jgi:hypothetical protein
MKTRGLIAAIGLMACAAHAQIHQHLNVGATSKAQNSQLIWANGADFAASSDYVNTMSLSNSGRFGGFYNGNITLTGLPATSDKGGPDDQSAALGSVLQFKIACLAGPTGGSFGFWDAGSTAPSISVPVGYSTTNLWRLSENDGTPSSDPYGHIHGRRFSATKPGIYMIGFTAVDTSTNGTGGGAIHTPSVQLLISFEAGAHIQSIQPVINGTRIRFAAPIKFSWQVFSCSRIAPNPDWVEVGAPVTGDDYFHEIVDSASHPSAQFYRLQGVVVAP